jgi:tetratricopeptide (TPR) repeat protein
LAIYDAQRPQAPVFPAGQDLRVLGLTYDAMALWVLGYPDQALEQSRKAMDLAEEVAHPWALAEQGQAREGLAQMQQGFAVWQANGQELGKPFWLALWGETHAKVEQVREGLQVLAEAVAMAQTRELRVWEADLHRLQGKLLLQQAVSAEGSPSTSNSSPSTRTDAQVHGPSHPFAAAETCFRQALEIACRQEAKSLELRAAMSLSQLWQQQGKKEAALRRLEESYHWFTEGFHTADLQEARVLLDHLAS